MTERQTIDFAYLVHYPVREDGVIQYKDVIFRSYSDAHAFAGKHDVRVQKVEVR